MREGSKYFKRAFYFHCKHACAVIKRECECYQREFLFSAAWMAGSVRSKIASRQFFSTIMLSVSFCTCGSLLMLVIIFTKIVKILRLRLYSKFILRSFIFVSKLFYLVFKPSKLIEIARLLFLKVKKIIKNFIVHSGVHLVQSLLFSYIEIQEKSNI